jgi:hypothetical protein
MTAAAHNIRSFRAKSRNGEGCDGTVALDRVSRLRSTRTGWVQPEVNA